MGGRVASRGHRSRAHPMIETQAFLNCLTPEQRDALREMIARSPRGEILNEIDARKAKSAAFAPADTQTADEGAAVIPSSVSVAQSPAGEALVQASPAGD